MNKNAIATIDNHVPAVLTPMELLSQAASKGASVEVLEKLMDMHERWEKNQFRKAFDEAISAAKSEIGAISKNRDGHNYRYADIATITNVAVPIMSKHGLSHRYRIAQTDKISVTCIICHKLGHSEETTLGGEPDKTGSKNAIQAIGSTVTYLERYTLIAALGLSISNDDTDGVVPEKRENPHVTRPEDISDTRPRYDEQGMRIDWIDTSEHRVQRKSAHASKEDWKFLHDSMSTMQTPADLAEWGIEHAEQVAALPLKWETIFQGRYQDYMDELRKGVPHNANPLKAG